MLDALMALPSFDARQERLTLLASTIEVRVSLPAIWAGAFRARRSAGDKAPRRGFGRSHALMGLALALGHFGGSAGGRAWQPSCVEQNQQGSCTECADRRSAGAIVRLHPTCALPVPAGSC